MISKIRDFIYNKNDILIAFLIMFLAVGVIGWRVKALFDYPKQLMTEGGGQTQTQQETPQGSQEGQTPSSQTGGEQGTQTSEQGGQTGEQGTQPSGQTEGGQPSGQTEGGQGTTSGSAGGESSPVVGGAIPPQEDTSTWGSDGKLTRDFTIKVKGNSATEAIQCLIEWELFKDYAEYKDICTAMGLDDEKVSGGTFTFKKGSTKNEIAKMVNWS